MFRKQSKGAAERVIVNEEVIDVAALRAEAKKAGTRFWVLVVLISLMSSLVVPYLSMASVVASNSTVFDGEVIPGYSMGGIDISSYGVDLNSWAEPDSKVSSSPTPAIVKSQYGYWTSDRAGNAAKNLEASQSKDADIENADLNGYEIDNQAMMSDDAKARGWIGITRNKGEGTGLSGFSSDPSGMAVSGRNDYSESVAPYRTLADYKFWDTQSIGGESPTVTTTIYPDFVIVGWDAEQKTARVLTNPDSVQNASTGKGNNTSASTGALEGTSAIPHYIPLSTLFKAYGIDKTVMGDDGMITLDTLLDKISEDSKGHKTKDGHPYSPILNKIVENTSHSQENDLLIGTSYENLNGANKSSEKKSDAWNPYPYSMVFKIGLDGNTVVSSIYTNAEAYVYFSPMSVYNNYMALRAEYDSLINENATLVSNEDPAATFQLGYYLAGMSILEAYLNEALPQDMTRGYVGPVEGNPLAAADKPLENSKKLDTRSGASGTVSNLFKQTLAGVDSMALASEGGSESSTVGFKAVAYSQLMYDFADAAIVKFNQSGEKSRLGATSAIMNTLSTYGYGIKEEGTLVNGDKSAGQGPNRGMTRRAQMARVTAFGPYSNESSSLNAAIKSDKEDPFLKPGVTNNANTGMYIPTYYPIQQHVMPTDPEMAYRFQVVSLIPYNTLAYELGKNGFNNSVSLSYTNNAIENLTRTKNYYNKNAALSKQLNDLDEAGGSLGSYDKSRSIVLNPQTNSTSMVGDTSTKQYAQDKDLTERVDNALRAFTTGRLNSDNVHDLVDVVRAIPGVKYETFMRYYNPIKSSGGATDIFLTRITPAQTAYMPAILTKGYESAGGVTNSNNTPSTTDANFDYFSLPSLAPCFAAHTAENTYYSALTYELRPFYTEGFLSSLPADSNVPALEQWEETVEEQEEVSEDTAIEDMKPKMLTIYILAKRLAYANAYSALLAAENGKEGQVTLGSLYHASGKLKDILPASDVVKKALTPNNLNQYPGPENDSGSGGASDVVEEGELPEEDSGTSGGGGGSSGGGGGSSGGGSTTTGGSGGSGGDATTGGTNSSQDGSEESGKQTYLLVRKYEYCAIGKQAFYDAYTAKHGNTSNATLASAYSNYCKQIWALNNLEESQYERALEKAGNQQGVTNQTKIVSQQSVLFVSFEKYDSKSWYNGRPSRYKLTTNQPGRSGAGGYTNIATQIPSRALMESIQAFTIPVASGDYIASTPASGTSQTTAYYDNGNGSTTAVAYANVDGQWVAQASSTGTAVPQANTLSTDDVNGVPVVSAESTTAGAPAVPATTAAGFDETVESETPADKGTNQEAKDTKGTGNEQTTSEETSKDTGKDDSSKDESGKDTGNDTAKDDSEKQDTSDRNYADNGGAADKIYTSDALGKRGYYKASAAQWKEIAGKHVVGDQITFYLPKSLKLTEGQNATGFDYVMEDFGQKHMLTDAVLGKKTVWCKESHGYAFVTSVKTIFTALYKDCYNRYLTPTGSAYYWDSWENLAKYDAKPDVESKDGEKAKYSTVAMDRSKAANAADAKKELDKYCEEAFKDAASCMSALAMLSDEMPAQMQNVLAWADTQSPSESEQNYLVDPSSSNETLIAIGGEKKEGSQVGQIHSLEDLKTAGFKLITNKGNWAAVATSTGDSSTQPNDLQSRMVRGVAGTTYTASMSLAAYTITATVGRIDRLVSTQSSTASIPYAGIYSGNLNSGAESCALIQGHAIDRQSISSRLAGDLRSRGTTGTTVSLNNSNSTAETQEYVKQNANLTAEFMASAIPGSVDMLVSTMGSTTSDNTGKQLASSEGRTAELSFSGIAGGADATTSSMALASTFDDTTMNRRSSVAQTFNTSSRKMANSGASATASASDNITKNRDWAKSLVDGRFSDAYSVIQSIALMMVLAFLMIIAFQNFVGYSSGNEGDYITAQTQLKTVLPRSLIAVAMIGLPPMGGSVGFPGGCYLLLQIVNAIMDSVLSVFTQGQDVVSVLNAIGDAFSWSFNIWTFLETFLNMLAALIFIVCASFIVLLVVLTDIVLFFFWALGPIAWAFYVWPYSAGEGSDSHGIKKMLTGLTGKMGSKTFTNGNVGRDAPVGWLMGYIMTLSTTVKWVLLYWGVGIAFNVLKGDASGGLIENINSAVSNAAAPKAPDLDAGEILINGAGAIFNGMFGNMILALLFALVTYMTFRTFKNSMGGALGVMYGTVGSVASAVAKTASNKSLLGLGKVNEKAADAAKNLKGSDSAIKRGLGEVLDSAPVKFGTDRIARGADAIQTIANGPGSADMKRRLDAFTDNMAKDVDQRADSSGAFDDLITTGTIEEQYTGEDGKVHTRKRQVIQAAPSLQMAGQIGTAALTANYQRARHVAGVTRMALEAASLANDAEYNKMRKDIEGRHDLKNMLGAFADSGIVASDAKTAASLDRVRKFMQEGTTRMLDIPEQDDVIAVGNLMRKSVYGSDGYVDRIGRYTQEKAEIASLQAKASAGTVLTAKETTQLSNLTASVAKTEQIAGALGLDAEATSQQFAAIAASVKAEGGDEQAIEKKIQEQQGAIVGERIDAVEKTLELASEKQVHYADKVETVAAIGEQLKDSVSPEVAERFDKTIDAVRKGDGKAAGALVAAAKAAAGDVVKGDSSFVMFTDQINQSGRQTVTDKEGKEHTAYTLGTRDFSKAAKQVRKEQTRETRVIESGNRSMAAGHALADDGYENNGVRGYENQQSLPGRARAASAHIRSNMKPAREMQQSLQANSSRYAKTQMGLGNLSRYQSEERELAEKRAEKGGVLDKKTKAKKDTAEAHFQRSINEETEILRGLSAKRASLQKALVAPGASAEMTSKLTEELANVEKQIASIQAVGDKAYAAYEGLLADDYQEAEDWRASEVAKDKANVAFTEGLLDRDDDGRVTTTDERYHRAGVSERHIAMHGTNLVGDPLDENLMKKRKKK